MTLYTDLNFELTDEQIAIKEETHKFAKEILRPASIELDKIHDPGEVINEILSCGDLFLLSSLNEGFGLVLLEAMAFKLPIVATRVGGVPEVVKEGQTGLLVPPENPDVMANAILKIHSNRDWGRDMGLAGYKRLRKMFDIRKIIEELESIYATLLNDCNQRLLTTRRPLG